MTQAGYEVYVRERNVWRGTGERFETIREAAAGAEAWRGLGYDARVVDIFEDWVVA